ncbi:hypothetical protein [Cryobacterium sp. CG_9.6]|uniref:hypothetical protein n=1 Tax=Cryobacterium sp. CG_9.6 TaxID=2760710 RepID=UPI0024763425|nr:hypothetical protein [Cryobacterium sp. CG_9.6]MDH6236795.1 hypothetical protein [Cryobacterium sp. CG_9.6]
MTPEQIALSNLQAQWWGVAAAFLTVAVAATFGYLTLLNNRRALDAQQRATLAAVSAEPAHSLRRGVATPAAVSWQIRTGGGNQWMLINSGSKPAYNVQVAGYTDLDQRRIFGMDTPRDSVAPEEAVPFQVRSRFTLRGPVNVIVTFTDEPDVDPGPGPDSSSSSERSRQTLLVPAR